MTYRLPSTTTPTRYELRLAPDLVTATFAGEETISVTVHEQTKQIVVNSCDIVIENVSISGVGRITQEGRVAYDETNEQASFTFPDTVGPGEYSLRVTFHGILNDKLRGFYRSTYKDKDGDEKIIATTQFESTDARRAFPCWDEPARKAVFQATLVIDSRLTAISNTGIRAQKDLLGRGKKEIAFKDTIKMSTYLVAFIVGELEGGDAAVIDGVPLRVWSVPGKQHLTNFARDIGASSLQFFSEYYNRGYPGDKLDLVAIPDFAAGAMENLGAITFRETALLIDEKTASRSELERVADVVSHENAHMWFGDLVTMDWWNGLWLNEAFATFLEMMAVDNWKPEWRRWNSFAISRSAALQVDGLQNSRPIEFPVRHPDDAAAMFDILTYEKGASVLRMLEQYLGAETFRKGISFYIKKHEYGNTETTDLWDAIETSTNQPVRAMMDTWVYQPGYPLITVAAGKKNITLQQEPFLYLESARNQENTSLWKTPIFLRFSVNSRVETRELLLSESELVIPVTDQPEWVIVNAGGHGFYRVQYTPDLLTKLVENPRAHLSPIERFNLINDLWATVQSGLTSISKYLDFLRLVRDESDQSVWATILGSLHYLYRVMPSSSRPLLESYIRELLAPITQQLGWRAIEGESTLAGQLRGEVLGALGTIGNDAPTQAHARSLYDQYKERPETIDGDVLPALVSIMAQTGGPTVYEEFVHNSREARTPQEEQRYQFALANFEKPDLLARTLSMTLDGSVRTQNGPFLIRAVLMNPAGSKLAWGFLRENWVRLLSEFPDTSIIRMCEGVTALATPELEAQVTAFFSTHEVPQGGKTLAQHLERLKIAVSFVQTQGRGFNEHLGGPSAS